MAVFVARKCACGGKLEFDSAKKIWICKYCGTVVEREATFDKIHVDGIEGINDVVRQTLKDIANQRMDSAAENLEDCERKGHKHIGTLLAQLGYNLVNISCAQSPDDARASLDRVKIYAERLKQEFPVIAEDEINLYEELGEDAADIYASLFVVYDTLGDSGRLDYISSRLRPEKVFSISANRTLLKVALKRKEYDVVDKIIKNVGHVDRKAALQDISEHYPSGGDKIRLMDVLFNAETAAALSKRFFENYFTTSRDSADVKAGMVRLLNTTDIHINAAVVVKNTREELAGYEDARNLFNAVYGIKLSDQETEALFTFCLTENKSYELQNAFLDTLIENDVFVALNAGAVISFLDSPAPAGEEQAKLLRKLLGFHLDARALDAVYNYYLNNNTDDAQTRKNIIDVLLVPGAPISTGTVENYVVKTGTDADSKPAVVEKIFATGIHKAYVGDLLSDYLLHSSDSEEVRRTIFEYLTQEGFKVDSNVFTQYVADSADDAGTKLERARQLVQNGTQIRADAVDAYIQSLRQPEAFSEELLELLTAHNCRIGTQAYAKYLLMCDDTDKVRHSGKLLEALDGEITAPDISIDHNGNSISCNVFQAYVLNTKDSLETAAAVAEQFGALRIKLNTDMVSNKTALKFKKYVGENKDALSPVALQLCEQNRMFSLF